MQSCIKGKAFPTPVCLSPCLSWLLLALLSGSLEMGVSAAESLILWVCPWEEGSQLSSDLGGCGQCSQWS